MEPSFLQGESRNAWIERILAFFALVVGLVLDTKSLIRALALFAVLYVISRCLLEHDKNLSNEFHSKTTPHDVDRILTIFVSLLIAATVRWIVV